MTRIAKQSGAAERQLTITSVPTSAKIGDGPLLGGGQAISIDASAVDRNPAPRSGGQGGAHISRRTIMNYIAIAPLLAATVPAAALAADQTAADAQLMQLGDQFDEALAAFERQHPACEAHDREHLAPLVTAIPPGLGNDGFAAAYKQAWDQSGHEPYHAANEAALGEVWRLNDLIAAATATTPAGLAVKAAAAWWDSAHEMDMQLDEDRRDAVVGFMSAVEIAGGRRSIWLERKHENDEAAARQRDRRYFNFTLSDAAEKFKRACEEVLASKEAGDLDRLAAAKIQQRLTHHRMTYTALGYDPGELEEDMAVSSRVTRAATVHREAHEAFSRACPAADEMAPAYDPINGEATWQRLSDAERLARWKFLAMPALSIADQRAKAAHLRWTEEAGALAWDEYDIEAIVSSLEELQPEPPAEWLADEPPLQGPSTGEAWTMSLDDPTGTYYRLLDGRFVDADGATITALSHPQVWNAFRPNAIVV